MKTGQSNTIQAFWIGLGSIATFTFSIVSAAILSRWLSKSDYGTYKQVMYVYNTLLVVFTLGLPKAYSYFLPKYSVEYGNSIVNKINIVFIAIGVLFSALLFGGASIIAELLNNPQLTTSLKLFALSPAFILPTMGIEGIMASYKQSHINAIYLLITRLILLLFVIGGVCIKPDCNSAIIGFTIASILNCFIGLYIKKIPFKEIKSVKTDLTYKAIFKFSIPLMVASIGGIVIKTADQFYVSRFFGTEVFADFSNGTIDLPFVSMVLSAAATVLLPEFSRLLSKEKDHYTEIVTLWRDTAYKSALLLYPFIIYSIFFAKQIMVLLYGDLYTASSIYFVIILIVDIFTIAPYYPIIIALGASDYYAKIHIWMSLIVWLLEFLSIHLYHSAISIAVTSALLRIVMVLIMTNFIAQRVNVSIIEIFPLKKISVIVLVNLIAGIMVLGITNHFLCVSSLIIQLIVSFLLFGALSFALGKLFHVDYLQSIQPILNRIFKK